MCIEGNVSMGCSSLLSQFNTAKPAAHSPKMSFNLFVHVHAGLRN